MGEKQGKQGIFVSDPHFPRINTVPRRFSGILSPLRADKSESGPGTYRQRQTVKENGYTLLSCMFDLWTQTGLPLYEHIHTHSLKIQELSHYIMLNKSAITDCFEG